MNRLRSLLLFSLPSSFLFACSTEGGDSSPRMPSGSGPAHDSGTPSEPLTLVPFEHRPGSTAITRAPRLEFLYRYKSRESIPLLLADLAVSSVFKSAGGTKVIGRAVEVPPPEPVQPPRIAIVPDTPLDADTWYSFSLTIPHGVVFEAPPLQTGDTYQTHFFTGSAPRVVGLRMSSKAPDHVIVEFSEPVKASTLDAAGLASVGAIAVSHCIQYAGTCQQAFSEDWLLDQVNVQLTSKAPGLPGLAVQASLPSQVRGAGRSVSEGAAVTGDSLSNGKVVVTAPASTWRACEGGEVCWRESGWPGQ